MPSLKNKGDIQKLAGRVTVLNQFIPKSFDRCLPFFLLLKGNNHMGWQMWGSIPEPQTVPIDSTTPRQADRQRAALTICGRIRHHRQCCIGPKRKEDATTSLLHQPHTQRCRNTLPDDRKTCTRYCYNCLQVETVLLMPFYHRDDCLSNALHSLQAKSLWSTHEVNSWIRWVWHHLPK